MRPGRIHSSKRVRYVSAARRACVHREGVVDGMKGPCAAQRPQSGIAAEAAGMDVFKRMWYSTVQRRRNADAKMHALLSASKCH